MEAWSWCERRWSVRGPVGVGGCWTVSDLELQLQLSLTDVVPSPANLCCKDTCNRESGTVQMAGSSRGPKENQRANQGPGLHKRRWAAAAASERTGKREPKQRVRGESNRASRGLDFDKLVQLAQPREIRHQNLAYIVL